MCVGCFGASPLQRCSLLLQSCTQSESKGETLSLFFARVQWSTQLTAAAITTNAARAQIQTPACGERHVLPRPTPQQSQLIISIDYINLI